MKLTLLLLLMTAFLVCSCASKKVVARKCEQAAQSDVWVCDPL